MMAPSPADLPRSSLTGWRAIRSSWRAIGFVRSRELHLNLGYWLILLGYNPRKREIENPLYTLYAVIFFMLWGFMVLLLLANYTGQALERLTIFGSPSRAALLVGVLAWLALLLVGLLAAARRSPAVFSDADSHLLAMSPIDRRVTGLVWFAEASLWRALWIWSVFIVLGYAHLEATSPVELTTADLPRYLLAGLRMLSVGIPLHLAADGLVWAVGVWRLQGSRERPGLRYLAPLLALLLAAAYSLRGTGALESLLPLAYPLRTGLGLAPLGGGLLAGWLLAAASLLLLAWLLPGFSLARAAQETRSTEALRASAQAQNQAAAQEIAARRRLGMGQAPARFPFRRGLGVLISRALVEANRTRSTGDLLVWVGLAALPLVAALAPDWGAQLWAALGWVLLIGYQVEGALRRALSRWWLLRSLPMRAEKVVLAELALPVAVAWLALAAGLLVTRWLPFLFPAAAPGAFDPALWMVALAISAVPAVALSAAVDLLRQVKSSQVLAGFTPGFSLLGVIVGMLAAGLPVVFYGLAVSAWGLPVILAAGIMLAAGCAIDYQLWLAAGSLLRAIK